MANKGCCQCCYDDSCANDELLECSANLGHKVCRACIQSYVSENLDGKNGSDFHCFVGKDCTCGFSEAVLAKALPEDVKESVDKATYQKSVEDVEGIWYV